MHPFAKSRWYRLLFIQSEMPALARWLLPAWRGATYPHGCHGGREEGPGSEPGGEGGCPEPSSLTVGTRRQQPGFPVTRPGSTFGNPEILLGSWGVPAVGS